VDAATKAGLLDLVEQAVEAGWEVRAACRVLELGLVGAYRWCMIAELGIDMTVFPTAGHLASWAGRCPANNRTGGKRRSGKPTRGNRWLGEVLIECAWGAARSRGRALDPGHRLAPAHRRLRRPGPGW
jgi:transposase